MRSVRGFMLPVVVLATVLSGMVPSTASAGSIGGNQPPSSGGTVPAGVNARYATQALNPSLTQGTSTLEANVPWPDAGKTLAGPANNWRRPSGFGNSFDPAIGSICDTTYQAGITIGPVQDGKRRETWRPPNTYIARTFDPSQGSGGQWLLLSPGAHDVGPTAGLIPDGFDVVPAQPASDAPAAADYQTVSYGPQLASDADLAITYELTGKVAQAADAKVCVITEWEYSRVDGPARGACFGLECKSAVVDLLPPASPPCSTAACVPAVESKINRDDLLRKAAQIWNDGGSVISSPDAQWEIVQVPAQFSIQGTPANQPEQYLNQCISLPNVRFSAACYQIHLHWAGAKWTMVNDTSGAQTVICSDSPTCSHTWDTIGNYHVKAVETIAVEYRWVLFTSPQNAITGGWQPYPGQSSFQLCSRPATTPAPDCGPGLALWVGQFNSVPVTPHH
jgi:hypothetical protein